MSMCKTATHALRKAEQIESSKINTIFLTTSPKKLTEDFLKCCLYIEKTDFECGPRLSKMAKIGTFAGN